MEVKGFDKFDVIRALTNAPIEINVGKIWKGNDTRTRKEPDQVFGQAKLKLGVAEELDIETEQDEEKNDYVTVVIIHKTDLIALVDSEATSNVPSSVVARRSY